MSLSTTPLHCAGYETQYQEVDVLITQENNAVLMLAQRGTTLKQRWFDSRRI